MERRMIESSSGYRHDALDENRRLPHDVMVRCVVDIERTDVNACACAYCPCEKQSVEITDNNNNISLLSSRKCGSRFVDFDLGGVNKSRVRGSVQCLSCVHLLRALKCLKILFFSHRFHQTYSHCTLHGWYGTLTHEVESPTKT